MTGGSFGAVLRKFRLRGGTTQRELAERAGLSTAAIRDLEQDRTRNPRQSTVNALATALDLTEADAMVLRAAAEPPRTRESTGAAAVDSGPLLIKVLGPVEVWHGSRKAAIGSTTQHTLLARLALGAGDPVSQDELVELLWDGAPPNAMRLLHTHVSRLRRLLESGSRDSQVLVSGPTGYRLAADATEVDLLRFRELTALAKVEAPRQAFAALVEAIGLWRGGIDSPRLIGHPAQSRIGDEYAAAVCAFATLARGLGEPDRALRPLRDLSARSRLDEPLHVELVLTLSASGRLVEALATYERIRAALADQLGIDPGEQLRAAQLAVLRQQDATVVPAPEQVTVQQAPAPPPDFVGRSGGLDEIRTALTRADPDAPGPARIVVINGIAGVGKTALALAAAQLLRTRYPDGQLYADLRGSSGEPVTPMRILGQFLRALGVPGQRIGTDEHETAALLRSTLAGRRMLVILDNARNAAQIRPLLPGTGLCDVLVTSRRRLSEPAGSAVLSLAPLARDESISLIAAAAGTHRLATDRDGAAALAEACARLPLALRIASARLATRQAWTISDLAKRLRDDNRRLTELRAGESSVLASFELSYEDLGEQARRAFRLCGLHPGEDFGTDGTGMLLNMPPDEADQVLEELLEANMLMQYTADRYRFHDLLGLYARRLLATDPERDMARSRLYDWYAEAVTAAMEWVYPQLVRLAAHPARERFFGTEADALAWLDTETPALLAVVRDAATSDSPALSWRITDQLRGYFMLRRQVDGWLPAAEAGMAAAVAAGDDVARTAMMISRSDALGSTGRDDEALADCLAGEQLAVTSGWTAAAAYLSHDIGWFYRERGKLTDADHWLHRALELTDGDEHGHLRAVALNGLGVMRLDQGEFEEAATLLQAALTINEYAGRAASALANKGNLASVLRRLGDEDRAETLLTAVLAGYRGWSNLRGELSTLDELSLTRGQRGDHAAALDLAREAHDLAVAIHDRQAQAKTAATLAEAFSGTGDLAAARSWFDRCLTIARDHRYPYLETRALIGLADIRQEGGDPAAASTLANQAASIAGACGFRALEQQALAVVSVTR